MNSTASRNLPLSARQPASLPRQLLAILIGYIFAAAANIIFYLLVTELFGIPIVAPPELNPIPVTDVVLISFIFSFGAGLVFLVVANISRRPAPIYLGIVLVVLVISLFLPFRMPRPPVPISTPVVLASMHVIGAAVLVPILIAVGLPVKGDDQLEAQLAA